MSRRVHDHWLLGMSTSVLKDSFINSYKNDKFFNLDDWEPFVGKRNLPDNKQVLKLVTSDPGTDARSDRPYLYFSQSSQKATKSWHWPGNQCSSVSVQRVNVHIVDAVNSIVWQKLLRVLNLRKTSIIYTVSSLDETSDISKLEQFHISDWTVKEQSRRDFSKLIKVEMTDRTLSAFLNEKIKISYTWPWAGPLPWVRRCRWQPSGLETQYLLLGDAILHNAGQDHHKPQGSLW